MKLVYELVVNDHTQLGGPMGSERIDEICKWICTSLQSAKTLAERDHKKRAFKDRPFEEIDWRHDRIDLWESQDLVSHGYVITEYHPITYLRARKM